MSNLKIYQLVDGDATPFPNVDSQIEIFDYTYNAKRMGGAPTISATVKFATCLDDVWTDNVYVEFKGEKYFLKQTPTSSYSNEDARYKHELELVSERIILDNVYFYDVVSRQDEYKPVTNSSKLVFSGTIHQFATRLNYSLEYAKLRIVDENGNYVSGYNVIVDDDIVDSEDKLITFEDMYFSNVLQEIYNVYELPYYFIGKEIHIGFQDSMLTQPFQYGINDELLSVTKTNANALVVNRATGQGSADNIPYYYPNMSEKGDIEPIFYTAQNGSVVTDAVQVINAQKYARKISTGEALFYHEIGAAEYVSDTFNYRIDGMNWKPYNNNNSGTLKIQQPSPRKIIIDYKVNFIVTKEGVFDIPILFSFTTGDIRDENHNWGDSIIKDYSLTGFSSGDSFPISLISDRIGGIPTGFRTSLLKPSNEAYTLYFRFESHSLDQYLHVITMKFSQPTALVNENWYSQLQDKYISLKDVGLKLKDTIVPQAGNMISQELIGYVKPQETLMPSIYRESEGDERFYNALNKYPFNYELGYELQNGEYVEDGLVHNDIYKDENGEYIEFPNPYIEGKPKEVIVEFSDIKPTIVGITNASEQAINQILGIAFDKNDNNETEEIDGSLEYKHPYFFIKLAKFNGDYPFNLFDSAIDEDEMSISMTSGNCSGCEFKIMVSDDDLKVNTVQVDDNGNLVRDDEGNVLCGRKPYQAPAVPQDKQNDTIHNEVWIAVQKDKDTFGTMLPEGNIKPAIGDSFVILHINLPQAYIKAAEDRLSKQLIKYIRENNEEKFTFSIKFSRIYLAENPDVINAITENALLNVSYNGYTYPLYVSSYTYKVTSTEPLPEITVELKDEIAVNQNALQNAITEVKGDFLNSFKNLDIVGIGSSYFLRKDINDRSAGQVAASLGFEAGGYTKGYSGAKIDEYGQSEFENVTSRSGITTDSITTHNYVHGLIGGIGGKFWVDDDGKVNLEVDNITARQSLTVMELILQEVKSVGGELVVSASNGEIEEVVTNYIENDEGVNLAQSYTIKLKDDAVFMDGDLIRCSQWDMANNTLRSYWVQFHPQTDANGATGNTGIVYASDFASGISPQVGDKLVQMGNVSNTERQGGIVISSLDNKPYISVYDGISSTTITTENLKGRFGDLSGLTLNGKTLSGYGIWSSNAYLNGEFRIESTGKTIEDEISSQITNDASSRNYARMTAIPTNITDISVGTNVTQRIYDVYGFTNGDTLTVSFDWEIHDVVFESNNAFISMQFNDNYGYQTAGFRLEIDSSGTAKGSHTYTLTLQGKYDSSSQTASLPISKLDNGWLYLRFDDITISSGAYIKISNLRVNKGKISHDWEVAPEDANAELNAYKAVVTQDIELLQSQIDGQVESWFYDYTPTLTNLPASEWTTDALKEAHIGDTFTNTQEYVNDTTTPDAGKSWRWLNKGGVYGWYLIADTDATKALALAGDAKDTADNKRRVFVLQPTPPYDEGDLWVNATYGNYADEILRCETPRASGASFSIEDWTKASKYTDDSATSVLEKEVYKYFKVADGNFTSIQGAITNNAEQGRNILLKTNQGVTNWELITSLDKNTYYSITKVDYGDAQGVFFSKFDWNATASYEVFSFPLRPQFIKEGYTYHLSFDARQTLDNIEHGPLTLVFALTDMSGGNNLVTSQVLSLNQADGNWHHYDVEFKASASGDVNGEQWVYIGVRQFVNPYWSDIAFANLKLEQSTVATNWSAAPEDLPTTTAMESKIEQTANEINLSVDNLKDDLETTGINIQDKKIEVRANQFQVLNNQNQVTAEVDAQGRLTSNVFIAKAGMPLTTINENHDGYARFYYPNTSNVCIEIGWDEAQSSLIRVYDKDGTPLWKLGSSASFLEPSFVEWNEVELYKLLDNYDGAAYQIANHLKFALSTFYQHNFINQKAIVYANKNDVTSAINGYYTNMSEPLMADVPESGKWFRTLLYYENGVLVESESIIFNG